MTTINIILIVFIILFIIYLLKPKNNKNESYSDGFVDAIIVTDLMDSLSSSDSSIDFD
jgi:hypothetical protein